MFLQSYLNSIHSEYAKILHYCINHLLISRLSLSHYNTADILANERAGRFKQYLPEENVKILFFDRQTNHLRETMIDT